MTQLTRLIHIDGCHASGASQEEIGSGASADLAAWIFFQISAGHILLPVLAATFVLSKKAARSPLVVNVCLTWIISSIVSSLLWVQTFILGLCLLDRRS